MKNKLLLIIGSSMLLSLLGMRIGFSAHQAIVLGIFCTSILGVLFFWELRLSFVFFGAGLLLVTRSIDLENFIRFASLDVILFLIGMMILVGMLNEVGCFYWIVTRFLRIKNLTGGKLFILLMSMSAVFSSLMGEVASIIIMTKVILDISDFLDIKPTPLILASILATNIGSAATVLGNPIGILIAARAGLSFEDFLRQALPVTVCVFTLTLGLFFVWFRASIREMTQKLSLNSDNAYFYQLISIPMNRQTKVSIGIFCAMLLSIVFHHRLEVLFNLRENTVLMMTPIVFAGVAMLFRRDRARAYIEHEVEWSSIMFFLFLFALAGVTKFSGISGLIAKKLVGGIGTSLDLLTAVTIYSSGALSSVFDNTIVVASYIPIIQSMGELQINLRPLWWAVLFGACYGGNMTVIGSTANIVAMDILEKKYNKAIPFLQWFKIGIVVGAISLTSSYLLLIVMSR